MKKIIFYILSIFFLFSIASSSFAKENYGYIGELLNLEYSEEETKINLEELKERDFKDKNLQKQFNKFREVNKIFKNEIINLYKKGVLDYNSTNYVIDNYNLFIYHTDKLFLYKNMKYYMPKSKEVDNAILSNTNLVKSYYLKIRRTIDENLKK